MKQAAITWEVEEVYRYKDEVGWEYTEDEGPAWVAMPVSWRREREAFRL